MVVKKSLKKIETCTFKLNIRENIILLSTGGGAMAAICRQTRHHAYFIHKCLFGVTIVPRSKLVVPKSIKI